MNSNQPLPTPLLTQLPTHCEVLVVGAGPAGSACARLLGQAGVDVVLVDQHAFPRDKTCGDGLIPDAYAALRKLGVLDAVMELAEPVAAVGCVGPSGARIDVPGTMAVLPRKLLDDLLCRAAVDAGARLVAPARFEAPLETDGKVVGARLKVGAATHELRARCTVLATGAVPQALIAAGMCERRAPSAVALRAYVHNPAMVGRITKLDVVWHRRLRPGYGWIFPCPGGVFNIGVGFSQSHNRRRRESAKARDPNLRGVFESFQEVYAPARELLATGTLLTEPKGAPLRCSLEGARLSRPGLLVTGEAAGTTYSFTCEGIGKALETGILAAEALLKARSAWPGRALSDGDADEPLRRDYEASLQALKPRFEMYEKANRVNVYPWLADVVIWRARKSARLLERMSGVLNETSNPGRLVSLHGLRRLLFG